MDCRSTVGDDLLGYALGAVGVDVGDDHCGTLATQRLGIRLPDAPGSAGDDGHLVFELRHLAISYLTAVATSLASKYSSKPRSPISRPLPDCL